jgi:tetratricopeptide (TPR) repeat protein
VAANDFIWRFTPSRTDLQLLEEIFVQRHGMLAEIIERVRESALTGNKHQVLLIGPRGIGKTHLITLLHHRITQDPQLAGQVRIAWLLEDETITSFVQLLKRIYESLTWEYTTEFSRDWLEFVLDRTPAQILKALESILVDKFREKTLLLIVENLDLLFDGLGDEGGKQWRAFLQTHPFTTIVATSQRLFKGIKAREQPFFGFFAPEHLRPLTVPDATELLGRIARHREQPDLVAFLSTPEGRSRVRALHHLAGGNHRIYIVLSGFITRESLDELAGPFEKMVDELTPYYQERMRWLAPQQRQIVEYLCAREGTCTPKEIARHLLATENTVGSQLKKLLELGYVLRSPRGRESLYELAEPLMRLASDVKERRHKPLRLLVNFLRIWYRPEVLPQLLAKAGSPSLRVHLQAAISEWQSKPDPRLTILEREAAKARKGDHVRELAQILEEFAHTTGSAKAWLHPAVEYMALRDFQAAIECTNKALEIDPLNADAWTIRGATFASFKACDDALVCFDQALKIDRGIALAWNLKGVVLYELDQHKAALECFSKGLNIEPHGAYAWHRKGRCHDELKQPEEALKCYSEALMVDPACVDALKDKGVVLTILQRHHAAVECFDKVLGIKAHDVFAIKIKGINLAVLGRDAEAVDCLEKGSKAEMGNSLFSFFLSVPLNNLGRYEDALECIDEFLTADPAVSPAWRIKADILCNLDQFDAAIECYDRSLEIDPRRADAWMNKGDALTTLARYDAAIDCYDKAAEIEPENTWLLVNRGQTLGRLGRPEAARECYERVLTLSSTDPLNAFCRCLAMFGLRRWEAGFAVLSEAITGNPRETRDHLTDIIDLILRLSEGREDLRRHVARLIAINAEVNMLAQLGDGIVRSLRFVDVGRIDVKTLKVWRDAWSDGGAGHADLEIPLRIFYVGVEYVIRGDEKVLLDLLSSERMILRQALGLDVARGADEYQ